MDPHDNIDSIDLTEMPEELHQTFLAIVALTDEFCRKFLNDEYLCLSREMAIDLCQDDSPANRGKPASWASGIVHALGMVNFLGDPTFEPYMPPSEIAKGFGVSQGNMTTKSKIIRDALVISPLDTDWCLPSKLGENPMAWMVEVNGFIMDARSLSLEVQQQLADEGAIPFVPESDDDDLDWDDDDMFDFDDPLEIPDKKGEQHEPRILKFSDFLNKNSDNSPKT